MHWKLEQGITQTNASGSFGANSADSFDVARHCPAGEAWEDGCLATHYVDMHVHVQKKSWATVAPAPQRWPAGFPHVDLRPKDCKSPSDKPNAPKRASAAELPSPKGLFPFQKPKQKKSKFKVR